MSIESISPTTHLFIQQQQLILITVMRFSLSLVSAAMLATLATAAPAPRANNNMEISSEAAPSEPIALEMGAEFQTFNWAADKSIDRTFTLNLDAPASLQITDYKLGKCYTNASL